MARSTSWCEGAIQMRGTEHDLRAYLRARLDTARQELAGLDVDYLLSENEDVLIAALAQKHFPEPVDINWGDVTRTPVTETMTQHICGSRRQSHLRASSSTSVRESGVRHGLDQTARARAPRTCHSEGEMLRCGTRAFQVRHRRVRKQEARPDSTLNRVPRAPCLVTGLGRGMSHPSMR